MDELGPTAYALAAPLFAAYRQLRPAVYTVLEGRQPGRIWVDDAALPRTALLVSDFCYLAGACDNAAFNAALLRRFTEELVPHRRHLLIWAAPDDWFPAIEALLAPLAPQRYAHASFALDVAAFEARASQARPLPEGFTLQPLDARTAAEAGGMAELWGSIDHFLANGLGYCIVQGDAFIASAQTVFIGDRRAEIGVGTREPYRRRGLASAVARALIARCLREGLAPEWGCVQNPASGALARSLGFRPLPDLPFYYVKGQANPI